MSAHELNDAEDTDAVNSKEVVNNMHRCRSSSLTRNCGQVLLRLPDFCVSAIVQQSTCWNSWHRTEGRSRQNFEDLEETGKKGDALECTKYKGWSSCMAVYKDGTSAQAGRREGGMAGGREGAREPFSFHTDSICRLNCRS